MNFRLLGAPWWQRWLILSFMSAVFLALLWGAFPFGRTTVGVGLAAIASLALGALLAAIQVPKHRAYTAALIGLSSSERSLAIRSLSGGEIPTDPKVLAAATELAGVMAAGRSTSRRSWVLRLVMLVCWAYIAIHEISRGNVTQGWGWAGVGLVLVVALAWEWYALRRLQIRMDLIREAAQRAA